MGIAFFGPYPHGVCLLFPRVFPRVFLSLPTGIYKQAHEVSHSFLLSTHPIHRVEIGKVDKMTTEKCTCSDTTLRWIAIKQPGRQAYKQFKYQCIKCGKVSSPISHTKLTDLEKNQAVEVDKGIADRYWAARKVVSELKREHDTGAWFCKHNAYLRSPEWAERRQKVLRRDYICQACLQNPATQAHHLTYDHWGHEPLYDLVAVCKPCHDEITKMDRNRRNGTKSEPELYDYQQEVTL